MLIQGKWSNSNLRVMQISIVAVRLFELKMFTPIFRFRCDFCDMGFTENRSLKEHINCTHETTQVYAPPPASGPPSLPLPPFPDTPCMPLCNVTLPPYLPGFLWYGIYWKQKFERTYKLHPRNYSGTPRLSPFHAPPYHHVICHMHRPHPLQFYQFMIWRSWNIDTWKKISNEHQASCCSYFSIYTKHK